MQILRSYIPANANQRRALVAVPLGLLIIWFVLGNRTPVVAIPNPVMPKLNAFDFYVKAGNAVIGAKQIGETVSTDPSVSYSLEQKESLVQQNVAVVNLLHQGFAYSYLNPPARDFNLDTPYYAKFHTLARLLSLEGQVRAARSDWNGAAESYLDALRLGEDIPHGALLIGALVGNTCRKIGRRPMWGVVEHLNAVQTRAVIARLAGIMDRHMPFTDTIQEEKWSGQSGRLKIFSGTYVVDDKGSADDSQKETMPDESPIYLFRSKQRIMDDFTAYMDRCLQIARKPYILRTPAPPVPTDITQLNQVLTSAVLTARIKDVVSETENGLLLVTLALHAFRLEHGHYPTALAELVPLLLRKLPDDPFASQDTFQYRTEGGVGYLLYSIGPDGKDDQGTPIDDLTKANTTHPETRYDVQENSVGDVVAGINR